MAGNRKRHPLEVYWQSGGSFGGKVGRPRDADLRSPERGSDRSSDRESDRRSESRAADSRLADSRRVNSDPTPPRWPSPRSEERQAPKRAATRAVPPKPAKEAPSGGRATRLKSQFAKSVRLGLRLPRRVRGALVLAVAIGCALLYADHLFPVPGILRLSKTSGHDGKGLDEWGDGAGSPSDQTRSESPSGSEYRIKAASVQVDAGARARTEQLLKEQCERLRKDLEKAGFPATPALCYLGSDRSQIGLMVGAAGSERELEGLRDWLRAKAEYEHATIVQVVR